MIRPSLRTVFETESSFVFSTLFRLGVQPRDVEDVAHEVFITVHRRLDGYDPSRPLRPWLFGIALRTALRYRALARHRREVIDDGFDVADPAPGADEQVMLAQARAILREAMAALDEDLRAPFEMYEVAGGDAREIASALGIGINTFYSRLRRSRARFREVVRRIRERPAPKRASGR